MEWSFNHSLGSDVVGGDGVLLMVVNDNRTLVETVTKLQGNKTGGNIQQWFESGRIMIPLYAIICMLAVIGNTLVILTLVQNQRMRTITNLFLLNLAISDLLLGVLCMPFTLIGTLLRNFIFGEFMCKLIPFLQACTVSVGVWTLVAISVERYYAICHPLRSLRWQTINHAYKLIASIWLGSLVCMAPIAVLSQLQPTKLGNHKCREDWPTLDYEKAYTIFLDAVLLIIPLLALSVTYSLITRTLCRGMRTERIFRDHTIMGANGTVEVYVNLQGVTSTATATTTANSTPSRWTPNASRRCHNRTPSWRQLRHLNWSQESQSGGRATSPSSSLTTQTNTKSNLHTYRTPTLRRTNAERSLLNKKRVIKMLFAVVLEFFICWTPLYTVNTLALFSPKVVYNNSGYTAIAFFQLLAYCSSCCNPITYCFMNCGFRKSFLNLFRCLRSRSRRRKRRSRATDLLDGGNGSDVHLQEPQSKWTMANQRLTV